MNNYKKYKDLFSKIYDESQIQLDAKMSEHIYFRVGGLVDILLTPDKVEQLRDTITICKDNNIPYYVIGNGSNIILPEYYDGVILKLTGFNKCILNNNELYVESFS